MTHEVRGPDPDGDWFVVLVEGGGGKATRTFLCESFCTAEAAQAAAYLFAANPDIAPNQ